MTRQGFANGTPEPGRTIAEKEATLKRIGEGLTQEELEVVRQNFRLGTMPSDVKGPFTGKPGKYGVRTIAGARELSTSQLENVPGFVRKSTENIFFNTKADAQKFLNSQLLEDVYKKSLRESSARGNRAFKRTNPALFKKIIQLAESGEVGPTAIGKNPEVVKLNKGKELKYNTIQNIIEGEKGKNFFKEIAKLKSNPKSDARLSLEKRLPELKADYLKGMSTIKLTEKYLPDSKARSSTTLESVLKDMQAGKLPTKITKAELAKRPDIRGLNLETAVKKDPKKLAAILEDIPKMANKEVQEKYNISGTTLNEIKNEYGLEFGKKLPAPKNPKVTERLNKVLKIVKSADLPLGSIKGDSPIAKKLADKAGMGVREFLVDVNRIRQNPTRLDLSKADIKLLSRFPDPGFTEGLLQVKGYSPKTVKAVKDVERAASSVTEAGSQLEHALPKSLIKEFNLPRKYLLTAERTTNFLNQFKKQFDNQLINAAKKHAAGEISYPEYKREVARITKIVSDKTGGYKMGYVDFKDGKPFAVTPQETLLKGEGDLGKKTKGLKNYFKNAIYHNKLYDNYTKNPDDPAFGTLREEIKQGKYNFVKEVEAENTAKAINNFTKPEEFFSLYQKDPNNIFFKALSKSSNLAGGRGKILLAGGATLPLLTTALAAETGNEIKDDSILPEAAVATAAVAPLATKTGRSIYGSAAKKALQALGTPSAAAGFAGLSVLENLKEGKSIPDAVVDKEVGIELLFPELAKRAVGKVPGGSGILSQIGRVAANPFFRAARAFTPVGAAITAAGLAKDYGRFVKSEIARKAADPEAYIAEQEEQMGIAAADGGLIRARYAEGSDDKEKIDKGRRRVVKILGGIASLPIIGRFFDIAKLGAPAVEKVAEKVAESGVPDYFWKLYNTIKSKGILSDEVKVDPRVERTTTYKNYKLEEGAYGDPSETVITKINDRGEFGYTEESMRFKKGGMDEDGFVGNEYEEITARPDAEGKLKDVEDGLDDGSVDEILEEIGEKTKID
jgi:hypothetical protein